MARVVHFEIHADDPARAMAFMEKTELPGVGWLACYFDTEGNLFGVNQPPAGA